MTTTAPAPGYYRLAREINNPSKPDRRRTAPLRGWKRSSVSAAGHAIVINMGTELAFCAALLAAETTAGGAA